LLFDYNQLWKLNFVLLDFFRFFSNFSKFLSNLNSILEEFLSFLSNSIELLGIFLLKLLSIIDWLLNDPYFSFQDFDRSFHSFRFFLSNECFSNFFRFFKLLFKFSFLLFFAKIVFSKLERDIVFCKVV